MMYHWPNTKVKYCSLLTLPLGVVTQRKTTVNWTNCRKSTKRKVGQTNSEDWGVFFFKQTTIFLITDVKILSFPCNQFGSQMPQKDGDDMMAHLKSRGVNVGEVFAKINVNGKDAAPLYTFLRQKQGDGVYVKWNFVKFLVDKNGEVVQRFASPTSPLQIAPKIDELLEK